MEKLTVVSGCPRSGTSLMMLLLREVFGEDRIIGTKWPQEPRPFEQQEGESDAEWALRQYREKMDGEHARILARFQRAKDMNPNGFWEMAWTVRGIPTGELQKEAVQEAADKRGIVKVVSQGLAQSSAEPIGQIIYMLRHPRAVAKSQEKLEGQFGMLERPKHNGVDIGKHSPRMFVQVTQQAAKWLHLTGARVLIVNFDDLIENPKEELERVREFLGEGDFTKAVEQINPKLRRSYPQEIDNPLWASAEKMYELMGMREFAAAAAVEIPEGLDEEKSYMCYRRNARVVENECNHCRTCPYTRRNYKRTVNGLRSGWYSNPCAWEVANDGVSIEDSIAAGAAELQEDLKGFSLEAASAARDYMLTAGARDCDIAEQEWLVAQLIIQEESCK